MTTNTDEIYKYGADIFEDDDEITIDPTPQAINVSSAIRQNRQILNIFFLVDVSGSMRGQRIGEVNYALENIFKELKHKDDINTVYKIGIMEFSETANWITPQPIPLEDFVYTKIEAKPFITCFGKAFEALTEKLSRKGFIDPDLGEYFAPIILFITDGEPTDFDKYPGALEKLKHNGWFRKSAKYAIAVGEEARTEEVGKLLSEFTDVRNNVRFADEGEALVDLIQFIAVRASEVQSSMISGTGGSKSSIFDQEDQTFSSMFS